MGCEMNSRFFTTAECECHGVDCCDHTCAMDDGFMMKMDAIRGTYGKPMYPTNAFRCNKHNKVVGGAKTSLHRLGKAMDICVKDRDYDRVAEIARQYCDEVIIYTDKNFIHIGCR